MVSVVPAGLTRLFQHPVLDWNLFSTKQQPLTDREVRTDATTLRYIQAQRHLKVQSSGFDLKKTTHSSAGFGKVLWDVTSLVQVQVS